MTAAKIDFGVLDDDDRWAHNSDCAELLHAGIWFLYETMLARYPRCPLLKRITRLGDRFEATWRSTQGDSSRVTAVEAALIFPEMCTLGAFGHSLWHLRSYHDSPGLRYELKELSKIGCGQDDYGDNLRLRGQGFLLLAAARLAKEGFSLEFFKRSKDGKRTHDFFAIRDGNRFCCEVTSKRPQQGDFSNVDFFWSTINEIVSKKKPQFGMADERYGVLIVDCTPIWDALNLSDIPTGELVCFIPPHLGGPRYRSVPCIRYDESALSVGLRNLEAIIRDSAIRTLILWKHRCEFVNEDLHREMAYRIIGAIDGAVFWSYFPKALAFPGPCVDVVWT